MSFYKHYLIGCSLEIKNLFHKIKLLDFEKMFTIVYRWIIFFCSGLNIVKFKITKQSTFIYSFNFCSFTKIQFGRHWKKELIRKSSGFLSFIGTSQFPANASKRNWICLAHAYTIAKRNW